MPTREEYVARFMAKVQKTEACWLWTGAKDLKEGYGHFAFDRKHTQAHRASYRLFVGDIPPGLVIDHLCRVRHCVNPAHLEAVTTTENIARGLRGRMSVACKRGHLFDEENTYTEPNGHRHCRTCGLMRRREARAAKSQAGAA